MYLKISKDRLVSMLNVIQNAVSSKVTVQTLNNFFISIKGSEVHLAATDLEIFVEGKFDLGGVIKEGKEKIELQNGECTVPAKRFIDMVRDQESGKMIEVKLLEGFKIDVKCGRSHFNLPGFSIKEYPSSLEFPKNKVITVKADMLKYMIEKTIFAISRDDIRYALNGVFFVIEKNTLKLVSTDSRRLAFVSGDIEAGKFSSSAIIPHKSLNELLRLIELSGAEEVKIGLSDNQVSFKLNEITLSSRLVDGEFPNYERVIPKGLSLSVNMKSRDLLQSLKQLQFLVQDSTIVKFHLKKGLLVLSLSVEGLGQGEVEVDVDYREKPLEIAFHYSAIVEYLKVLKDAEIKFDLSSAVTPVMFSVTSSPDTVASIKEYRYIVMPIRND